MNKYTFTDEGIYIVGFDLGGTLLVVGCVAERKIPGCDRQSHS